MDWRKSSYSAANSGFCVDTASGDEVILIPRRDGQLRLLRPQRSGRRVGAFRGVPAFSAPPLSSRACLSRLLTWAEFAP